MKTTRRDFLIAVGLLSTSVKFGIDTFSTLYDEKTKARILYEYPNYVYPITCNTEFEKVGPIITFGTAMAYKDYIITAAHIVYQKEAMIPTPMGMITLPYKVISRESSINDKKLEALIINNDDDIAIFKNPCVASLRDKKINPSYELGDTVYTISNPKGMGLSTRKGIIMDTNGLKEVKQTDDCFGINVIVASGDSGGAVFNKYGEYIGMIVISTGFGGYVKKADQILKTMNEIRGEP